MYYLCSCSQELPLSICCCCHECLKIFCETNDELLERKKLLDKTFFCQKYSSELLQSVVTLKIKSLFMSYVAFCLNISSSINLFFSKKIVEVHEDGLKTPTFLKSSIHSFTIGVPRI